MIIQIIITIGAIYALTQYIIYQELQIQKYKWKRVNAILAAVLMLIGGIVYYTSIDIITHMQFILAGLLLWQLTIAWYQKPTILEKVWITLATILVLVPISYVQIIGYIAGLIYVYRKQQQVEIKIMELLLIAAIGFGYSLNIFLSNKGLELVIMVVICIYMIIKMAQLLKYVLMLLKNVGKNSVTDALTGLFNRGWFFKKLEQFGEDTEVGLIFGDIDNFKRLNDTKGHEAGDNTLRQVAKIFQETVKGKGWAARYGGEEMVCLVTNGDTIQLAEQIRSTVESTSGVTISLGVFVGKGKADDIVKIADERMYYAKKNGKNRVVSTDIVPSEQHNQQDVIVGECR